MQNKDSKRDGQGRRGFLKFAGLGAAAGASGAASLTGASGEAKAASEDKETSKGYRETEHVKKFYEVARF